MWRFLLELYLAIDPTTLARDSSVRRIFERGGQEIQKIRDQWRPEWKISSPKPSSFSCPKLGEETKKKVFAHRFCAHTFCPSYKGGGHTTILHTILC